MKPKILIPLIGLFFLCAVAGIAQEYNYYSYRDVDIRLMKGCEKGIIEAVKSAVDSGANVNFQDYEGYFPLLMATFKGDSAIVVYLLKKEAYPNMQTTFKESALQAAAIDSNMAIAELLLKGKANPDIANTEKRTPLHIAAETNNWLLADMLLYYKANINVQDSRGIAPLHIAVDFGYLRTLLILLDYVPDVNIQDNKGNTPLHYAAVHGDTLMANYLIDYGADINLKNKAGFSPFLTAVAKDQFNFVKYLDRNFYLDFNETSSLSRNVLSIAQKTKNEELISYVKKQGAEVNRRPEFEGTSYEVKQSFNGNDYLLGYGFRVREVKYNFEIGLLYASRPYFKQVIITPPKDIKTQYWEKRRLLSFVLQKNFTFSDDWMMSLNAKPGLLFGKYRGVAVKPLREYYISPGIQLTRNWHSFQFTAGYEYLDLGNEHISPHRITIGLAFKLTKSY